MRPQVRAFIDPAVARSLAQVMTEWFILVGA